MKKIKNSIRITVGYLSCLFPTRLWSIIEAASAYFQGKGSGSDFPKGEVKAALQCVTGDNLVFFDVGANHGDWTAELLSRAGLRIKMIYLFEPSPVNQELLKKRFAGDERVTIVTAAVSDKKGSAQLFSDIPGSGQASLYKRKLDYANIVFTESLDVSTITLDDFIMQHAIAKIDYIKMDIEGHELSALRGAAHALASGVIKATSFEFGGCNIDSRTYFRTIGIF
jgi:FkbM family methyltransferase